MSMIMTVFLYVEGTFSLSSWAAIKGSEPCGTIWSTLIGSAPCCNLTTFRNSEGQIRFRKRHLRPSNPSNAMYDNLSNRLNFLYYNILCCLIQLFASSFVHLTRSIAIINLCSTHIWRMNMKITVEANGASTCMSNQTAKHQLPS